MKICVYCSSSDDLDQVYYDTSKTFAIEMAKRGHSLVYGGYERGIMGLVARTILDEGGTVVSVIPKVFNNEDFKFSGKSEFIFTEDISNRKKTFEEISDAFVILPGGIGTMDELFETFVRKNFEGLNKPICILNVNGCFDKLEQLLKDFVDQGFMTQKDREAVSFFTDVNKLLDEVEK